MTERESDIARAVIQRINLPWPPTTNNLFLNVNHGRVLAPKYRAWLDEAGWTLQAQHPHKHNGPVNIVIELHNPTKRRADADNRVKAVLDLLVKHQVIGGDDYHTIRSITARWVESGDPCRVFVEAV